MKITAIDSVQKKTNFVNYATRQLCLDNLDVIWGRAREIKIVEKYDYVIARAVSEPIKIFKECKKFLNISTGIDTRRNNMAGLRINGVKNYKKNDQCKHKNGKLVIYQTPKTAETISLNILNKLTQKYLYVWKKSNELLLPGGEKRMFIYAIPSTNVQPN